MRLVGAIALALLIVAPSALAQDAAPTPYPPPSRPPALSPTSDDLPMLARAYPVPPPPHRGRLFGAVDVGYSYQTLYDIPINGIDIAGVLGADLGSWTVGAEIDAIPGRTDGGLSTFAVTVAGVAEARVDRFRFGGGLRLGGFNVDRVTTSGSLGTLTAGAVARFSVDVAQFDDDGDGALFIVVKGSVDATPDALYGAGAGLGIRF